MSMNTGDKEINWELALHDIMDTTCQFLNLKDLSNVAKVNKSWRGAVICEKAKRVYIQQLHLPYKLDNLASMLYVNPYTSLLIYDSSFEKSLSLPADNINSLADFYSNGLEEELLDDYLKKLPHKVIVLRVDEYLSLDKGEGTQENNELELTRNCNMLGLFFPSVEQRARVLVASILNYEHYEPGMAADHLAEKLGLNDRSYPNSTMLLFFDVRDYFAPKIVSELHKRTQNGEKMTWIGIFGSKLAINKRKHTHYWSNRQNIVAMRIFGPSVKSWSTFIRYCSQRDEIECKLYELKERIKSLEHYCTGLFYSVKCIQPGCSHIQHPVANRREFIHNLKRVFPGISFLGLYGNVDFSELPTIDDRIMDKIISGQNESWFHGSLLGTYTAIMIISYNN